ncbi:DUF5050 domain-containing protein [Paenibacillus sp. sgz500958]|uniref:DUF5050 domain-containing protein n=1 Tax=Paenibacillus sp. sgz500958 TaxID=3242475 RepID=UPI0036D43B87
MRLRIGVMLLSICVICGLFGGEYIEAAKTVVSVKLVFPTASPIIVGSTWNAGVATKPKVKVVYSSDNSKVAAVNAQGMVSGVSVGRARITAAVKQSGYSGQATLTVEVKAKPIKLDEREVPGSTDFNMVNGSYMLEDQENLYYIAMKDYLFYGGPIYKISKGNPAKKQLIYSGDAMYMVKQGDWIYFSDRSGSENIYKIRTDGTGLKQLNDYNPWTWNPARNLTLIGNWIYYGSNDQINKMLTDGTKDQIVFQDPEMRTFFVSNGWIYYVFMDKDAQSGIKKVKIGGTQSQLVVRMDTFNSKMSVKGDWIYYAAMDGFYRIKNDGTGNMLLTTGTDAVLLGDSVYYVDSDGDGFSMYRMKEDGSGKQRMMSVIDNGYSSGNEAQMLGSNLYYITEEEEGSIYELNESGHRRNINGPLYIYTTEQLMDAQNHGETYIIDPEDIALKQFEQALAKAREVIKEIILPDMTDDQKLKAVHDYMILHTAYDYDNYLKDTIPYESYTEYGLLIKGTAVCNGYATTLQMFMNLLGIESYYVVGTILSNGGAHAWNVVKIDGKYYQVDVTWDDPVPDRQGRLRYDYYKITDAQMTLTRQWDRSQAPVAD